MIDMMTAAAVVTLVAVMTIVEEVGIVGTTVIVDMVGEIEMIIYLEVLIVMPEMTVMVVGLPMIVVEAAAGTRIVTTGGIVVLHVILRLLLPTVIQLPEVKGVIHTEVEAMTMRDFLVENINC